MNREIEEKPLHEFMERALELAEYAATLGEVPVAAVVVKDQQIIAEAHNRRELDKDPTAHAEILAIKKAAEVLGDWRLEGCTVYVTLEPCAMCAGAMWLARIDKCVYGCKDPKSGYLGSLHDISQTKELNHHYEVCGGVLEERSAELLKTFFRRIRKKKG